MDKKQREGMENVSAESKVPLFVAKRGVKLAQSWVVLLIAPRVLSVLEVDFFNSQVLRAFRKRSMQLRSTLALFLSLAR